MKQDCKRIIIIGEAGRGKSTLAAKISEKLGIKKYSTDDFYYEYKYFKAREREIALDQIKRVYMEDSWIVEGTTQWLLAPGLNSADLIIYLKYKNIFIQWWVIIKRHFHRKDESIKSMFILLRHVFYKRYSLGYKKGKPTHMEVLAPYKDKVVVLSSFKEIDVFIAQNF